LNVIDWGAVLFVDNNKVFKRNWVLTGNPLFAWCQHFSSPTTLSMVAVATHDGSEIVGSPSTVAIISIAVILNKSPTTLSKIKIKNNIK